jgi:hypothetical protein
MNFTGSKKRRAFTMEKLPEPGDRYFKAVLDVINDSIARMTRSDQERKFYESLVAGGNHSAASVVTYCEGMKELYNEGSAPKALELTKLFTLLMLAQSYRWLTDHQAQTDESREAIRAAAANVLAIFGDADDRSVELFLRMKTQFDHDAVHHPSMTHMGGLMLAWAAEAMGHSCFEWENVKFPVVSVGTLTQSGAVLNSSMIRSPKDIEVLWACHGAGCKILMGHHEGKEVDRNSATDNPESN